jgi:hypothetical protein
MREKDEKDKRDKKDEWEERDEKDRKNERKRKTILKIPRVVCEQVWRDFPNHVGGPGADPVIGALLCRDKIRKGGQQIGNGSAMVGEISERRTCTKSCVTTGIAEERSKRRDDFSGLKCDRAQSTRGTSDNALILFS